ncbi:polyprenyl synthetase family protein [Humidisolicoccus flavus]
MARDTVRVAEAFGFTDRLFSTPEERRSLRSLEDGLDLVEQRITTHAQFADPVVDGVTRYLTEAGGKRVRPMLVLLAAQLGDGVTNPVIDAAAAIEITHLASLYHDDVMDEAATRRGVPSAHTVWGNSVAILAGDLLFARAANLFAPLGLEAARIQAQTFERLCLGQMRETLGPGDADPVEHYIGVLQDKTGSLIAASAELGVLLSNSDPAYRAPLRAYGEAIGVAFQLVDDVIDLDLTNDTGKDAGNDLRAGVPTLPLLLLRQQEGDDSALVRSLTNSSEDETFRSAVAALADHEATAATRREAERWQQRALAALEPLPVGPVRRGLTKFAESVVERRA